MGAVPWYKRYPSDFISATLRMTLEEKGAYSMLLDMIYDGGGPIPDDPQWIARVCGCSTRRWNQLRSRLIDLGKISVADGKISAKRVAREIRERRAEHGAEELSQDNLAENTRFTPTLSEEQNPENSESPAKNNGLDPIHASARAGDLARSYIERKKEHPSGDAPRPAGPGADLFALDDDPADEPPPVPAGPAAPPPAPPSIRDVLWRDGVPILQRLTGKPERAIRGLLGRMLRDLRDDCAALYAVLRDAESLGPADPMAWLAAAVAQRAGRRAPVADRPRSNRDKALDALAALQRGQPRGSPEPDHGPTIDAVAEPVDLETA